MGIDINAKIQFLLVNFNYLDIDINAKLKLSLVNFSYINIDINCPKQHPGRCNSNNKADGQFR